MLKIDIQMWLDWHVDYRCKYNDSKIKIYIILSPMSLKKGVNSNCKIHFL